MKWLDDLPQSSREKALKAMDKRKQILSAWYRGDLGRELARRGIDVMNRRIERIVLAAND
jgi:hypothetical protein